MWSLHAMTWCRYLETHPGGRTWIPRPWYPHKTIPYFLDVLAIHRWVLGSNE